MGADADGAEQDDALDALRRAVGEQERGGAAYGVAEEGEALEAEGVGELLHVVAPALEGGDAAEVGVTEAGHVGADQVDGGRQRRCEALQVGAGAGDAVERDQRRAAAGVGAGVGDRASARLDAGHRR